MKIGIIGSREFKRLDLVEDHINGLPKNTIIVTGGVVGVDKRAKEAARRRGFVVIVYEPDYLKYGSRAPHVRNTKIVKESDKIIAFWNGDSTGTKSTIEKAKSSRVPVEVHYDGQCDLFNDAT